MIAYELVDYERVWNDRLCTLKDRIFENQIIKKIFGSKETTVPK